MKEETTFPCDVYERDFALATLLASEVGYRLRSKGLKARTICLKLKFPDFSTKTRSVTLTEATESDERIYSIAAELFARCCDKPPWCLVGVRASGLERGSQLSLVFAEGVKKEKITPVLDMLWSKFGRDAILKANGCFYSAKMIFKPVSTILKLL
jgi:DNA polymerase-4